MQAQSLNTIAEWCHGRLFNASPVLRAIGISTDSRAVQAGELFVALTGDKFDGHDFLADVCAKGSADALAHCLQSFHVLLSTIPARHSD
jgi:UDP-N-acetylmuramoyl-tripeptide--D-alanyl-D-alanine ligase